MGSTISELTLIKNIKLAHNLISKIGRNGSDHISGVNVLKSNVNSL
jgi:hypothetical protein